MMKDRDKIRQINRWLAPPVFEGDEEKTWRASLLNAVTIVSIILVALIFIGNLIGGRIPMVTLVVDGIMLAVALLLRRLLFDGKVTLPGIALITTGIVIVTAGAASLGTIRTPTTAGFMLLVIVAGLLFGQKGLVLSTVSSSLAVLGLMLAENAGLLPRPDYTVSITQWVTYTALFGLTGALTYFSYQSTVRALKRMIKESTERKRAEEALRALALLDELTDLYNRRGFSILAELAEQQLKMTHRGKRRMLLLFADLDGMKRINDTFGHQEGDRVLIEAADALEETFRESDIIARIGGDEFVVLAVETNGSPAEVLIHRLQENLEARNARGGCRYELSLSVGLARYDPERPCSIEELLTLADRAMYERKRGNTLG